MRSDLFFSHAFRALWIVLPRFQSCQCSGNTQWITEVMHGCLSSLQTSSTRPGSTSCMRHETIDIWDEFFSWWIWLSCLWTFVSCFIDIQDGSNKFQQIIASWSVGCAPWYSEVPEAPPSLRGLPEDYVNAPGLCEAFAPAKSSFWVGRTEWTWWISCCWMM